MRAVAWQLGEGEARTIHGHRVQKNMEEAVTLETVNDVERYTSL